MIIAIVIAKMTIQISPKLVKNAIKSISGTALPIIIFGGSPISVAVPPILEDIICAIKNGCTGIFSCAVILKVTGTVNKTVVTLSKNAEQTAVRADTATNNFTGLAFTFFSAQISN